MRVIESRRLKGWQAEQPDQRIDEELLAASIQDPSLFGPIYDRHARDVLAFFYRRTASADLSGELTAETFAAALSSRHTFRDGSSVRGWLFGIARHQLGRYLRRKRVDTIARRRLGMAAVLIDDTTIERLEAQIDLQRAIQRLAPEIEALSPRLREALVMRVLDGMPYSSIARRLGCSEGAARVRVSRALTQLSASGSKGGQTDDEQ